jgi:hypothetical protein
MPSDSAALETKAMALYHTESIEKTHNNKLKGVHIIEKNKIPNFAYFRNDL